MHGQHRAQPMGGVGLGVEINFAEQTGRLCSGENGWKGCGGDEDTVRNL